MPRLSFLQYVPKNYFWNPFLAKPFFLLYLDKKFIYPKNRNRRVYFFFLGEKKKNAVKGKFPLEYSASFFPSFTSKKKIFRRA